jgi:FkbM family methyltransferase
VTSDERARQLQLVKRSRITVRASAFSRILSAVNNPIASIKTYLRERILRVIRSETSPMAHAIAAQSARTLEAVGALARRVEALRVELSARGTTLGYARSADSEPQSTWRADAPQESPARRREAYRCGERFILTDLILDRLAPEEKLTIIDGGARDALEDPRWRGIDPKRLRMYGFEPDPAECQTLNRKAMSAGLDCRYFPTGLWESDGTQTLHLLKAPGASSLFPPNAPVTERWKFAPGDRTYFGRELMVPVRSFDVPVTTLDGWAAANRVADVDFVKLNVQGAELAILRGAPNLLRTASGVQLEVAFVESYVGRPLFADVDVKMRGDGFTFMDLIHPHYIGREASPITLWYFGDYYPTVMRDLNRTFGQLIEGHGVYFRDYAALAPEDPQLATASAAKLFKAVIIAEVYYQVEYAFELLTRIRRVLAERGDDAGAREAERIFEVGVERWKTCIG